MTKAWYQNKMAVLVGQSGFGNPGLKLSELAEISDAVLTKLLATNRYVSDRGEESGPLKLWRAVCAEASALHAHSPKAAGDKLAATLRNVSRALLPQEVA